jgi:hypothetical protein
MTEREVQNEDYAQKQNPPSPDHSGRFGLRRQYRY